MPDLRLSTSVNKHYLNKLMKLAQVRAITAAEDVVDIHGIKVLARGHRIDAEHFYELSGRKLKKPIESSLAVADALDIGQIAARAARIMQTSLPIGRILSATGGPGPAPLDLISSMQLGMPLRVLLTMADNDSPHALEHSICVCLLSICMARKLRLGEDEQRAAGLAGLLHDIGELYVDPAYLTPGKRLLPHEWAHLVVHPRVGQMLINELDKLPLAVGRAVAEHHERFDGTGYPRQVLGNHISPPGQAVSVAEMIAAVLHHDLALERAELALKIIPGEHARELLSAISGTLRGQPMPCAVPAEPRAGENTERLFRRIAAVLDLAQQVMDGPASKSPRARELLARALERIKTVERAFISTGLDAYLKRDHGLADGHDDQLVFEKSVATREIQWRLRDLARDLALHTASSPDEKALFASLIELLDDDSGAELRHQPKAAPLPKLDALKPSSYIQGRS